MEEELKQDIKDPSTEGVGGLKSLAQKEQQELKDEGINISDNIDYLADNYREVAKAISDTGAPQEEVGIVGFGDSKYDKEISSVNQLDDLNELRATEQSNIAQVALGVAKGTVLAGTTFLDGTIGLVYGVGEWINQDDISKIWDNDFGKAMQEINEASEEAMPNYYSEAERNDPWYQHIFSGNFIGDKFLKNIGFSVGALYGGAAFSSALKFSKIPQIIGAITKSTKAPALITSVLGATVSAVNEGRVEALNNTKEWYTQNSENLKNTHGDRLDEIEALYSDSANYDALVAKEKEDYNSSMTKLAENRAHMGNVDLLLNIPLLMASNLAQFRRLYSKGFDTARKTARIVGDAGKYSLKKGMLSPTAKAVGGALSEGVEEVSQSLVSEISGQAYSADTMDYYKSRVDPKSERKAVDWIKAFGTSLNKVVNEGSTYEEFTIGALTGAMGMPKFRSYKTKDGSTRSPLAFTGGIYNETKEGKEEEARLENITNYMNERANSKDVKPFYKRLIQEFATEDAKLKALEGNDKIGYKDADFMSQISDISAWDAAGKKDDLIAIVESSFDTSDENIEALIKNTTSVDANGRTIGPFVDKNGNPAVSTKKQKQAVIETLTKSKDEVIANIEKYTAIKNDIDIKTGERFKDDDLEQLIFMKMQVDNWDERIKSMSEAVVDPLSNLLKSLDQSHEILSLLHKEETDAERTDTKAYKKLKSQIDALKSNKDLVSKMINNKGELLSFALAKEPKIIDMLEDMLTGLEDTESGEVLYTTDEVSEITTSLNDIFSLNKAIKDNSKRFDEAIKNPEQFKESLEKINKEISEQDTVEAANEVKDKVGASESTKEAKDILTSLETSDEDGAIMDKVRKGPKDEKMTKALEMKDYKDSLQNFISNSDADDSTKAIANSLIKDIHENASDINDLSNPNQDLMNDLAKYIDEENDLNAVYGAQYLVSKAMAKANKDKAFKELIDEDYTNYEPKLKTVESNSSYDNTNTVLPTNGANGKVSTVKPGPIGLSPDSTIKEENKTFNNSILSPVELDNINSDSKIYYRPSIPELHIGGVKEGDFRPFNVVVAEKEAGRTWKDPVTGEEKAVNFDEIYTYLLDKGVFDYVNSGKLKEGDVVNFMIDPAFNNHTVFMVKGTQVIGSLDESDYKVAQFKGLKGVLKTTRDGFGVQEDKNIPYVSSISTTIQTVMNGVTPFSEVTRDLSEVDGVQEGLDANNIPNFAIVQSRTLMTNKQLTIDTSIVGEPKDGRIYMLLPNAKGNNSLAALRVKSLGEGGFDLRDNKYAESPIGKKILKALKDLSETTDEASINAAKSDLLANLYLRDYRFDYYQGPKGSGIKISRVQRDQYGQEVYTVVDGTNIRSEETTFFEFTKTPTVTDVFLINSDGSTSDAPDATTVTPSTVITEKLIDYFSTEGVHLQVDVKKINTGSYNKQLINSNVFSTNINSMKTKSAWFTTDVLDKNGKIEKAINPTRSQTPTVSTKGSSDKAGILTNTNPTSVGGKSYLVSKGTVYNSDGTKVEGLSKEDHQLILDTDWAKKTYGDASFGVNMYDRKCILPDGKRGFNLNTGKYLTAKEVEELNKTLNSVNKGMIQAEKIIQSIYDKQKFVNKEKTDGDSYYITEADGKEYPYSRVHSVIGSNWVMSEKQTKSLAAVKSKLFELKDDVRQFDAYLVNQESKLNIDLKAYRGKVDSKSRNDIMNIITDGYTGNQSKRALDAGTAVDTIIRNFFDKNTDISKIEKPANVSDKAYKNIIDHLVKIQQNIEENGETFYADNVVLFHKFADGTRIAGEVDILVKDADGNFKIYDVKTSKYSFHDFINNRGEKTNYFKNKASFQTMSTENYYSLQLSSYQNLFESMTNKSITQLAVMPFKLGYKDNTVTSITPEKGIPIKYNPAVRVPNEKVAETVVKPKPEVKKEVTPKKVVEKKVDPKTPDAKPVIVEPNTSKAVIFNTSIDLANPINIINKDSSFEDGKPGYFVEGDKVYKASLRNIGNFNGNQVYLAREAVYSKGMDAAPKLTMFRYRVVLENGHAFKPVTETTLTDGVELGKSFMGNINDNADKMGPLLSKVTMLSDYSSISTSGTNDKVATPHSSAISDLTKVHTALNAPKKSIAKRKKRLRETTSDYKLFNKDSEIAWLNRVLPQLTKQDLVKIQEGLIKASDLGTTAWGQFKDGIITLSDIASTGTVYHEAFHAVFDVLLSDNQRSKLLSEARIKFGMKSDLLLEEDLAEAFREYVMIQESTGFKNAILKFFKNLHLFVKHLSGRTNSIDKLYYNINRGKLSKSDYVIKSLSELKKESKVLRKPVKMTTFTKLESTLKNDLIKKGWTKESFESITNVEKEAAIRCAAL